jgi:hypothetical protein
MNDFISQMESFEQSYPPYVMFCFLFAIFITITTFLIFNFHYSYYNTFARASCELQKNDAPY